MRWKTKKKRNRHVAGIPMTTCTLPGIYQVPGANFLLTAVVYSCKYHILCKQWGIRVCCERRTSATVQYTYYFEVITNCCVTDNQSSASRSVNVCFYSRLQSHQHPLVANSGSNTASKQQYKPTGCSWCPLVKISLNHHTTATWSQQVRVHVCYITDVHATRYLRTVDTYWCIIPGTIACTVVQYVRTWYTRRYMHACRYRSIDRLVLMIPWCRQNQLIIWTAAQRQRGPK